MRQPAHVPEREGAAVVEQPPGPHVRIRRRFALVDPELARHAEVDDQPPAVVEPDQQVLAPAVDRADGAVDDAEGAVELVRRVGASVDEATAEEHRFQAPTDGLHLGQLGHEATVPDRSPNAAERGPEAR